jgi:hypothetical protein
MAAERAAPSSSSAQKGHRWVFGSGAHAGRLCPRADWHEREDDPVRLRKHTPSPAHFLRELKLLGDVGFVAPRADRPVLCRRLRGAKLRNEGVAHA